MFIAKPMDRLVARPQQASFYETILPCAHETTQFGNFQDSDFSDSAYNSTYIGDVQNLIANY